MPGFLNRLINGPEKIPQPTEPSNNGKEKYRESLKDLKEKSDEPVKPQKLKVGGVFSRRPERRTKDIKYSIKKRSDIQIPGVHRLDQQKARKDVIDRNFPDKKWIGRKAYDYKIKELENKIPDLKYEAKKQAIRDKKVLEQFRDAA